MKIYVTVGTQLPFDRLLEAVDSLNLNNCEITWQIANSNFKPKFGIVYSFVNEKEYARIFKESDLIISHAGMGSIISAIENAKPIVLMPRLSNLNEHRNNHQLSTSEKFMNYSGVWVVNNPSELMDAIYEVRAYKAQENKKIASESSLLKYIHSVIKGSD